MNVTDDLEPKRYSLEETIRIIESTPITLSEGEYIATHLDGTTTEITVKPGASMTIWTQSTIERV